MQSLDHELAAALLKAAAGTKQATLRARADALSNRYRSRQISNQVVGMADELDALAYACYRMPATYRALHAALTAARDHVGGEVRTHVDLGGGTGAGAWAAASIWPRIHTEVVERQQSATRLGARLFPGTARWTLTDLRSWQPTTEVDLVTIGYVLNELDQAVALSILQQAARTARVVVVVEPGTPDGYAQILKARDHLIKEGLTIAAPCSHQGLCPLAGRDWCHFAVRVSRTELHRELKDGTRNFEDEKFAYVVATRSAAEPAGARVITRPLQRKGHVLLDLCTADCTRERLTISRSRPEYSAARSTTWGAAWD